MTCVASIFLCGLNSRLFSKTNRLKTEWLTLVGSIRHISKKIPNDLKVCVQLVSDEMKMLLCPQVAHWFREWSAFDFRSITTPMSEEWCSWPGWNCQELIFSKFNTSNKCAKNKKKTTEHLKSLSISRLILNPCRSVLKFFLAGTVSLYICNKAVMPSRNTVFKLLKWALHILLFNQLGTLRTFHKYSIIIFDVILIMANYLIPH